MFFSDDKRYADRAEAGRELAKALASTDLKGAIVLALPRGGVPVGYEVAKALGLPLDILLVRKIGAPGYAEFGIGAVTDGDDPQIVLNDEARGVPLPYSSYVEEEAARQLVEIARRRKLYVGERPPPEVKGRTVLLVDDGIATGGTVRAALRALRKSGAGQLILAVPVAPPEVISFARGRGRPHRGAAHPRTVHGGRAALCPVRPDLRRGGHPLAGASARRLGGRGVERCVEIAVNRRIAEQPIQQHHHGDDREDCARHRIMPHDEEI